MSVPTDSLRKPESTAARTYVHAVTNAHAHRTRLRAVLRFEDRFGDLGAWNALPVSARMAASDIVRAFVAFAAVFESVAVDAIYVVQSSSKWGAHLAEREPVAASTFRTQATSLGFCEREAGKMWSKLAQICVIAGATTEALTSAEYVAARAQFHSAVVAKVGRAPKSLNAPLFGLDALMFHRGQGPRPHPRKRWAARSVPEIGWDRAEECAPVMVATMRRYLDQIGISLRVSSVDCIETTLRQFAGHLATTSDVVCVADIDRTHIEAYKTWLAARPGYRKNTNLSKTTIGMRMGHLSAFYQRIIEWDYPDIPARAPVYSSDRPIKDKPLPRFLDDGAAAKFLTAARNLPDEFGRLAIEMLSRTGMRKGELLDLTIDSVVQIGSAYWLRIPVGKLHNDRYVPLHPQLKTMIDTWLEHRPDWQDSPLLFTDRGRPIPGTRIDKAVQSAAAAAGIGHVHPHQLRHTLATQAINRGMSLEAIAALLGHKTMEMTMVYARIADRTVADQYFSVTEKVEALYSKHEPAVLPAEDEPAAMRKLRAEAHRRMLGNGYCARPVELDCHFESICESCTFFVTTIEFLPTLTRQRDDAADKGQIGRQKVFDGLIQRLDDTGT
ncbi:tyrosine-type recombinase/integrase [Rhodococcus qingshengii]|jgi:integrase|uniref:tyrosine-type recombinase/integrase n=3 Tax=Actinomycetes TaxID=1760 RepID=UPI0001A21AA2|nr:tyrosine-type recombinase/integrase [Rhodococcus sp. EPR-134]EEN86468.1 site-specific recombinase, phage integrase family [Rhodococcus erythropolis SK121]KZF15279.1 integrase [Rhodococcus sp. EPR-134]MCW0191597.1 tyrosine-type recombinase/integrase [Rhodococcus sp. (in: high G+C Gram-positive bacteria)]